MHIRTVFKIRTVSLPALPGIGRALVLISTSHHILVHSKVTGRSHGVRFVHGRLNIIMAVKGTLLILEVHSHAVHISLSHSHYHIISIGKLIGPVLVELHSHVEVGLHLHHLSLSLFFHHFFVVVHEVVEGHGCVLCVGVFVLEGG